MVAYQEILKQILIILLIDLLFLRDNMQVKN